MIRTFGTFRCQSCGESAKRLAALSCYGIAGALGSRKSLFSLQVVVVALRSVGKSVAALQAAGRQGVCANVAS